MGDHISYKKRSYNSDLDLTVTIRYQGLKATQYFTKFTDQSLTTLRQDLIALKIPHPKSENIALISHGCVEFSWFGVEPYKILHNNLISKLRPNTPEGEQNLSEMLKALSIASATFRANPSNTNASFQSKKRPYPAPLTTQYPPRKKFATRPTPPQAEAAEKFLSDTLKTLKSEPVEVQLPPPSFRYDSQANKPTWAGPSSYSAVSAARHSLPSRPDLPTNPPSEGSAATSDDTPTYQSLMKELWAVRRQASAAKSREMAVVDEIKKLKPAFNPAMSDPQQKEIVSLKAQLEATRRGLEFERRHREELEIALDNIRKEEKQPFIVPGLLDAFLSISNLAAQIR